MKSCEICQLTKGSTQLPMGLLTPLNVPTRPWESIAMDFISFEPVIIPCSKLIPGYKDPVGEKPYMVIFHKMLVITCTHSNYTFLIPCVSHINAQGVLDIFTKWIRPTIGYPHEIVTDQDPLFMLDLFQEWMVSVGIEHKASTTYHPHTDGALERKNRTIIPIFVAKKLEEGKNWVKAVPDVQLELNLRQSSTRQQSPFYTLLGFQPRTQPPSLPHPILVFQTLLKDMTKWQKT